MTHATFLDRISRFTCVPLFFLSDMAKMSVDLSADIRDGIVKSLDACQERYDAALREGIRDFEQLEHRIRSSVRQQDEAQDKKQEAAALAPL